jgi:hypothetical protein
MKLWIPHQERLLYDLNAWTHPLAKAESIADWASNRTAEPGLDAPVSRFGWGRIVLEELRWDEHQPTVRAEDLTLSRRCLIPVATFEVSDEVRSHAFRPAAADWTFLAAVWLPFDGSNETSPRAFSLLTVSAGPDLADYCLVQPIPVHYSAAANWLNPIIDVRQLLVSSKAGTFEEATLAATT